MAEFVLTPSGRDLSGPPRSNRGATFPSAAGALSARGESFDKKSRQIKSLERILIAKVCQLLRNSL
jgi:hypothetical protein